MTSPARKAAVTRKTNETDVTLSLNLDGTGANSISTGIGFLDHMLDLFGKHSLIDLSVQAEGDLHIDAHHTAEDVGLVLGQALREALGDKRGISRYGHAYVPMDEALARAVVDFSGRPHLVWDAHFEMPRLGAMETELFREFFQAVTNAAQANVHIHVLYGDNSHHKAEACFKAFARAVRMAVSVDPRTADQIPSTKGALDG
ncbi:MAG: imidazoleglycerol-phosphate dehydratase HisB [Pseudomonadota bacterium]|nr:imidazoleglycerol-phosphate dehydratase HisB [Pseudomonadota bacterium]